jgi:predicted Zn-dependent protease
LDPLLDEPYLTLAQAAQRQNNIAEYRLLLAQAMELQGRPEAALAQYEQAGQLLGPDHPRAEEVAKKTEELEQLVSEVRRYGRR